jgi:hypothetical protein
MVPQLLPGETYIGTVCPGHVKPYHLILSPVETEYLASFSEGWNRPLILGEGESRQYDYFIPSLEQMEMMMTVEPEKFIERQTYWTSTKYTTRDTKYVYSRMGMGISMEHDDECIVRKVRTVSLGD